MRYRLIQSGLFLAILGTCAAAWAQNTNATLTGRVLDSTGSVIAGAQVEVISTETNVQYPSATNGEGIYLLANLRPGTYRIEVSKPGFRTNVKPDVVVHVQDMLAINFTLSPGSTTETITVEGGAPLLNTESAAIGTVIDSTKVENLPLNGRNFVQLAQLIPGVQAGTPGSVTVRRGRGSMGQNDPSGSIGMSANGSRDTANRYYIDGVELMDYDAMTYPFSPSVDSLSEFKVETSTYSAESGGAPGGQVNLATKSGGNQFHGTLWEFNRNDAFSQTYDALAHVDSASPRLNRNQFGANASGPVLVPKLYNGRGKTFFFFNWESGRLVQGSVPESKIVPTAAQRAGDFTGLTDSSGKPLVLADKLRPNCIVNNIIRCPLSPQALGFLAFEPLPNTTPVVTNGVLSSNYNTPRGTSRPWQNNYNARIDHNFSAKDVTYGRYIYNDTFEASLPVWGHDTRNNLGNDQNLGVTYVHTFTPSLINDARFGWNRFTEHEIFATTNDPNFNVAGKMGLAGISTLPGDYGPPDITISGPSGAFNTYNLQRQIGPRDRSNAIFQYGDTISWQHGSHFIKFGAEIDHRNVTFEQARTPRGQFSFDGTFTGSALADFMEGYVKSVLVNAVHTSTDLTDLWHAYFVNDQWKVSQRLTVNVGLRYDYFQPYTEAHDRYVNIEQTGVSLSPTARAFTPANSPFGRGLIAPDRKNFGPRVGVAWQPGGVFGKDFVVRTGYGIYYTPDISNIFFGMVEGFQAKGVNITSSIANPIFFSDRFDQIASTLGPFPFAPSVDPHLKSSYTQQWNFDLQQRLPGNILADVGYVGSKGTRLDVTLGDINRPIQVVNPKSTPPPPSVNSRRPNQTFLRPVKGEMSIGNSTYHSLQAKAERRMSHGLLFLTAYTWAKSISGPSDIGGDVGGGFFIGAPQDIFNLKADRSLSGFDQTHRFVQTVVYDLPFFRKMQGLTGSLLGGWQASTIISLQSGFPTFIDFGQDTTGTGVTSRADLLPGQNGNLPRGQRTVQHYFNTAAFAAPPFGRFGNSPRTGAIRMPGSENVDFAVVKQFRIKESRTFEFRGEIFNLFNHFNPSFISSSANQSVVGASPNLKFGTQNFGKIGNGVNGIFQTRVIQLGAKLYF